MPGSNLAPPPEPTSITDSYSLLKALNRHPRFSNENSQVKMIANKVESKGEGQSLFQKLNAVVNRYLGLPLTYLGEIPADGQLSKAVMQQMPVSLQTPQAKSAQAFEMIAAKLMDKEIVGEVKKRGMAAFFAHIASGRKINL